MAARRSFVDLEDDDNHDELQQLQKTPKRVAGIGLAQSQPHAITDSAKVHQRKAPPSSQHSALRRDPRGGQVSRASDLARSTWSFPCTSLSSGAQKRDHSERFTEQNGQERREPAKPRVQNSSNAKIVAKNSEQSVIDLTEESSYAKFRTPVKLTEPVCIHDDSDIEEVVLSFSRNVGTRHRSIQLINPDRKRPVADQVESFHSAFEREGEDVGECEVMSGVGKKTPIRSRCTISSAVGMVVDLEVEDEQIVIDLEAHEDRIVIDLEEVEEQVLRDLQPEVQSPAELNGIRRRSTTYLPRNQPIVHPFVHCEKVELNGKQLTIGKYVETTDGDFYRITDIFQNPRNSEIALRGHRLQRSKYLNGLLPKKRNELCWVVELEADDRRTLLEQSSVNINPATIKGLRRANLTNWPFPSNTFRDDGNNYLDFDDVEQTGMLAVRWRSTAIFSSARDRFHNVPSENVIQRLLASDLDEIRLVGLTISDEILRSNFRGHTEPGGAYKPIESARIGNKIIPIDDVVHAVSTGWKRKRSLRRSQKQHSTIDLTDEGELEDQTEAVRRHMSVASIAENEDEILAISQSDRFSTSNPRLFRSFGTSISSQPPKYSASLPKPLYKLRRQRYTYGDAFCGAGGATRGAVMAGLEVKWGFDFSEPACKTWHQNFPEASMYRMWAHRFIARSMEGHDFKVDIMHLSPPCQFFSPAHTVQGKDDEMNSASLFACGELLDVARPRVATLEQTFGLYHAKFRGYFNSLIHMFTSRGFSIRWKICPFQNWGLPQRRHRLVIIASCPGEVLPEFPPFTHGEHSSFDGVKKWNSVDDVLNGIPVGAPDHDIHAAMQKPLNMPPWDSTSFAPRCITTHGGHIYHPSGVRAFTNREFASLQGFPLEHTFSEPYVKRQIGNAVPPSIAKVLFMAVKKALEKADGIKEESIVID